MHTGHIGYPSILPDWLTLVGPSAVPANGQTFTPTGLQDFATPDELSEQGIHDTIADFARAASNAIEAGFDGVEIHGANGYLLHQFLSTNANQRTDDWGGPTDARIRFPVAMVDAVTNAIGADRVGLRVSPATPLDDIAAKTPTALSSTRSNPWDWRICTSWRWVRPPTVT